MLWVLKTNVSSKHPKHNYNIDIIFHQEAGSVCSKETSPWDAPFEHTKHVSARKPPIQLKYSLTFHQNVCSVRLKETSPWDTHFKLTKYIPTRKTPIQLRYTLGHPKKEIRKHPHYFPTRHMFWMLKRKVSPGRQFKHPKHILDNTSSVVPMEHPF